MQQLAPPTLRLRPESVVYCISDLHLSVDAPELLALFESFLRDTAAYADALIILGDLFEGWIGDDDDAVLAQHVIALLAGVSKQGTLLRLLHGNRDFLLGRAFAERCGAELWPDYSELQWGTQSIRLFHGDAECTNDLAYQNVRSMLRSSAWQTAFLARSLSERRAFERQARASSMAHQSGSDPALLDVAADAIAALHAKFPEALLLHGHTHRPGIHQSSSGTRIVLGDWGPNPSWLALKQDQLTLVARASSDSIAGSNHAR
jgi:UDP-2,3-diacylglucosamine hydrolase